MTFNRLFKSLAAAAVIAMTGGAALAQSAPLQLTLREGRTEAAKIVVAPFSAADADSVSYGGRIAEVISRDLGSAPMFQAVDAGPLVGRLPAFDIPPEFSDVGVRTDALGLVTGETSFEPDGRLLVRFRLWDIGAQTQISGFLYRAAPDNWRRIAHRIADAIYERLVGDPGYFETRIAFVAESGPKDRRRKRLAVMDYDGEGVRYLSDGDELVLTPRYSPGGQVLTYIGYRNGRPRAYLLNIDTGQREVLGEFNGMMFSPRFSPDGSKVLMSLERRGNTDIYEMDLASRRLKRLTTNPAIDTAPSYAPDGASIVFESDRGGEQQIYILRASGGDPKRISFGRGRYAAPVWSPRGDLIAFTKMSGGKFSVGVMTAEGGGERILTESFLDESPTWAPNGRRLMFYRAEQGAGGAARLYSVDVNGGAPIVVPTPGQASDPDWGPSLGKETG